MRLGLNWVSELYGSPILQSPKTTSKTVFVLVKLTLAPSETHSERFERYIILRRTNKGKLTF